MSNNNRCSGCKDKTESRVCSNSLSQLSLYAYMPLLTCLADICGLRYIIETIMVDDLADVLPSGPLTLFRPKPT